MRNFTYTHSLAEAFFGLGVFRRGVFLDPARLLLAERYVPLGSVVLKVTLAIGTLDVVGIGRGRCGRR